MNQPAPKTIAPIIDVSSVDEIRRFYVDIFGFEHVRGMVGKDGQFDVCCVAKDGARIMFERAPRESSDAGPTATKQSVRIYLEVTDVERYFEQLNDKKGAVVG